MATTELHTKHRPQEWDQIVGNATIVKAIRKTLDAGLCSAFLFTGEPGLGKALALDTPIPTPSGWTTMGKVRVGGRGIR